MPPPVSGDLGFVTYGTRAVTDIAGKFSISCATQLGARKKQEDRSTIITRVHGQEDVLFAGVFDGTVGDYAAEFSHLAAPENILGSKPFREAMAHAVGAGNQYISTPVVSKIERALAEGYRVTDDHLLAYCREHAIDYSSCTSVTAVLAGDLLSIAHLGDSKIVLGRDVGGLIMAKPLTQDHKPDQPEERRRIERCGGFLAYLHGGKPFIRGGDFTARQEKGERPMQLNYSRAFGGKDLKSFGLIAVPDILQIQVTRADRLLIVASDGLWDAVMPDVAVFHAWEAHRHGRDPAADLVEFALSEHERNGTVDNVTVCVIIFK